MKYGSQMKKNMQEETDRRGASALPEGFDSVCEEVAAAVHDAWTKEKIAGGQSLVPTAGKPQTIGTLYRSWMTG